MTPDPIPNKWPHTLTYFACLVGEGFVNVILGPSLQALADNTQTSLKEISLVFTVKSFGFLVSALVVGRVFDKISGHRVTAFGLIGAMLLLMLLPSLSNLWLVALVLWMLGMMEGCMIVGTNTFLTWLHRERSGPFMNALHFCFGVGALASPLLIGFSLERMHSLHWAYWAMALLLLPIALAYLLLPTPTSYHTQVGSGGPVNKKLLFGTVFLLFLYVSAEVSMAGWVYTYAIRREVATPEVAAYLNSAFWTALTAGRLLSVWTALRLRLEHLINLHWGAALLSVMVLLVSGDTLWGLTAGTLMLGFSFSAIFPSVFSWLGLRTPVTGAVTGWCFVGAGAGGMTLPGLLGPLFETFGPTILMWQILGLIVTALVVFWWLRTRFQLQDARAQI